MLTSMQSLTIASRHKGYSKIKLNQFQIALHSGLRLLASLQTIHYLLENILLFSVCSPGAFLAIDNECLLLEQLRLAAIRHALLFLLFLILWLVFILFLIGVRILFTIPLFLALNQIFELLLSIVLAREVLISGCDVMPLTVPFVKNFSSKLSAVFISCEFNLVFVE